MTSGKRNFARIHSFEAKIIGGFHAPLGFLILIVRTLARMAFSDERIRYDNLNCHSTILFWFEILVASAMI